ncbi:hypothetical protein Tco_0943569 [Tanacetum coccineum]
MAVIWNPSIRKSVSIVIPNVLTYPGYTVIGFGVCPDDTSDPKLVKINVNNIKIPYTWVVEVFTLNGIIYWRTAGLDEGLWSNYIISLDLKRKKFGEVSLSERLACTDNLVVAKGTSVFYRLLGFRNNGEVVLVMDDDNDTGYAVEVYEPSSGHISGIGMNGNSKFSAMSYMETLILLHESNSIIH